MKIIWNILKIYKAEEIKDGTNRHEVRLDSQENTIITVLHLYLEILFHLI